MRLLFLIAMSLLTTTLFSQTVSYNNIIWVADGNDSYLIDSVVYDNGQIMVTRTSSLDSTAMDAYLIADSVSTFNTKAKENSSYNSNVLRLTNIQSAKSIDSLQLAYYTQRLLKVRTALDSLRAN